MKRILSLCAVVVMALMLAGCEKEPVTGNETGNGTTEETGGGETGEGTGGGGTGTHEYVDLGLSSGTLWATCNVGANSPEEFGDYFAWGEISPKNNYTWSTYKYCNGDEYSLTKYCTDSEYGVVDNKTTLELSDDAAHVNWGGSWRMPTRDEIKELVNECMWIWTEKIDVNGYAVNGYRVVGPNDRSIFLPAAGGRDGSSLINAGASGYSWSSSLYEGDPHDAYGLYFYLDYHDWSYYYRCCGLSVRPVCSPSQK